MKKGLLATACAIVILIGLSTTSHAQMKAGGGLAFGTEAESLGLTGNFYTAIQSVENLSVGGDFIYFLPKNFGGGFDRTWFEINLNGQYSFYSEEMIRAYAIGGLNIARIGVKYDGPNSNLFDDYSDTEIGLNVGVGGEYAFSEQLLAFAELKFVLSDADQAVFSVGIRLPFGGQ